MHIWNDSIKCFILDDKKCSSYDKLLSKSSLESSSGWRLYHLSSQFDDLSDLETEICRSLLFCKSEIPHPSMKVNDDIEGEPSEDSQLELLHELLKGNLQRCEHSIEQLSEAKQSMFNVSINLVCGENDRF